LTRPVYKIEVWQSGNLLYTITDDALSVHVKEIITDNVGYFSFILPTVKGSTSKYYYNDINIYDTVKIYLGYDSISASDLVTVGKIYQISAPLRTNTGYIRVFAGKNQGEILKRRLKRQKKWEAVNASDIVTELANDLSLGTTEIETDTTAVTLMVDAESYFDVLKKVSDYWYDATTQIKKDFYVDINNNLVWKSRPIRSTGVETLTVGDNVINYQVLRDVQRVRNKIHVYGQKHMLPTDGDLWTESGGSWGGTVGTYSWNADAKVGSYSRQATRSGDDYMDVWLGFSQIDCTGRFKDDYDSLHFWIKIVDNPNGEGNMVIHLQLSANSTTNYYQYILTSVTNQVMTSDGVWYEFTLPLGPDSTYWSTVGSPSWSNITNARWFVSGNTSGTITIRLDGLYFYGKRYYNLAEDATSQTNYGVRELEYVDETLVSDADCQRRGEVLLYQLKNPVTRIDISTPGNTNIKIGDRLSLTIPAEGISASNFDVVSVDHTLSSNGFITTATLVNTSDVRTAPAITKNEVFRQQFAVQNELGKGKLIIR